MKKISKNSQLFGENWRILVVLVMALNALFAFYLIRTSFFVGTVNLWFGIMSFFLHGFGVYFSVGTFWKRNYLSLAMIVTILGLSLLGWVYLIT